MTHTCVERACANAAWHSSAAAPVPRMSGGTKVCCLSVSRRERGAKRATQKGQQPLATHHDHH